jgi:hypothetical protein
MDQGSPNNGVSSDQVYFFVYLNVQQRLLEQSRSNKRDLRWRMAKDRRHYAG